MEDHWNTPKENLEEHLVHPKDSLNTRYTLRTFTFLLQVLAHRTQASVGPGSYGIREAIEKLKKKPCMAKLSMSTLQKEDCYEIINNIRVLQPVYIKGKEKRIYSKQLDNLMRNKLLKRINESFVFQRSIMDDENAPLISQMNNQKSRNVLSEQFDYQIHERPKTQENIGKRRRFLTQTQNYQFKEDPSLANINDHNTNSAKSQQQLMLMNKFNSQPGLHKKPFTRGHTQSLVDKETLMNGSTNASMDQYNKSYEGTSSYKKSKPKKSGSIFTIKKSQPAQSKKLAKQIINNNYFINMKNTENQEEVNGDNIDDSDNSQILAKSPNLNTIQVAYNTTTSKTKQQL